MPVLNVATWLTDFLRKNCLVLFLFKDHQINKVPERTSSVAHCSLNNQISYHYREFMLSCHLCDFSYVIMQFNGAHSFLGERSKQGQEQTCFGQDSKWQLCHFLIRFTLISTGKKAFVSQKPFSCLFCLLSHVGATQKSLVVLQQCSGKLNLSFPCLIFVALSLMVLDAEEQIFGF